MEHIEKSWLSPDKGIEKTRTGRNNRKINSPSRFSNGSKWKFSTRKFLIRFISLQASSGLIRPAPPRASISAAPWQDPIPSARPAQLRRHPRCRQHQEQRTSGQGFPAGPASGHLGVTHCWPTKSSGNQWGEESGNDPASRSGATWTSESANMPVAENHVRIPHSMSWLINLHDTDYFGHSWWRARGGWTEHSQREGSTTTSGQLSGSEVGINC